MELPADFARGGIQVANHFVRNRNVLLSEFDAAPLFVDYYLHRKDHRLEYTAQLDGLLKDFLAAFALHGAARPRNEVLAWTIRFPDPLASLFLVGDTEVGAITGRVFTEGVRPGGTGDFYQEVKRPGKPLQRSMVEFEGSDTKSAVERYYFQSEQRPGRFFHLGGDRYALLTAHPDWDEAWFDGLTAEEIHRVHEVEETNLLETRVIRWLCGCSHGKMLEVLAPLMRQDPENLFQGDETIEIRCPRCAGRYRITREALENRLAQENVS